MERQPADIKLLVYVLQGLVNRTQPRLYVYDRQYEGGQDAGLHRNMKDWWKDDLQRRGHRFKKVSDYRELLRRFRRSFRGVILYEPACWTNPALAENLNAVTTLCGLDSLLPATAQMSRTLRLPVVADVRGRWRSADEVERWASSHQRLRAACNRRVVAHRHPWSLFLTDYIVAHKIYAFWMGKRAFQNARRRQRYGRLLGLARPNAAVLGAWQSWWPKSPPGSAVEGLEELALLKFISDNGRFLVPVVSVGNFTVHSGFRAPVLRQKPLAFRPLEKGKVYVCFLLSDGDNVSGFMLIRPLLWQDPARGKVPLGWTFSPALLDLCPNVLEYFYRTATSQDYFVTGCSGYGYVMAGYGSSLAQRGGAADERVLDNHTLLDGYLQLTRRSMDAADSREMWNWWVGADTIQRFVSKLPRLNGMFIEPAPRADAYQNSFHLFRASPQSAAVPVFHNFGHAGSALAPEAEMRRWLSEITARVEAARVEAAEAKDAPTGAVQKEAMAQPRFVFLGFNGFQTTPSRIADFARRLPENYVVVRPDEFVHLYKASKAAAITGSTTQTGRDTKQEQKITGEREQ